MPRPLLLSSLPPTKQQERFALAVASVLLVVGLVALPFRDQQWPRQDAFIPAVDTALVLSDLITAVLLYAQFRVVRRLGTLTLASGYLFTAMITLPHALTFPGAFSPTGLLGAGLQSSAWLYTFCHLGLPPAAIAYVLLEDRTLDDRPARLSSAIPIVMSIVAIGAVAAALTWLVTAGAAWLPPMMSDIMSASATWREVVAPPILLLSLASVVLMWRRRRSSVLDLWIAVVLFAWFIETVLLSSTVNRFSVTWYVSRSLGLMASSFVLLVLLSESTMHYARLSLSVAAEHREREGRRMTMDVMAASIAHELQQPLAAIAANSSAGMKFLAGPRPQLDEVRVALEEIDRDGRRAGRIVESIRATFTAAPRSQVALDVNDLVHETVTMLRVEMRAHQIALQVEPAPDLPQTVGDRGQLQQVLLNVLTNAVESMVATTDRPRTLRVQSTLHGSRVVSILVEDSGTGVDSGIAERIFDPFFTTKSRGMGLGLALCRSIVEAHGGRLSVSPAPQYGSVFRVDLPTTSAAGRARAADRA